MNPARARRPVPGRVRATAGVLRRQGGARRRLRVGPLDLRAGRARRDRPRHGPHRGGIEACPADLGDADNVTICQANIFQPPFQNESFDFVMSWGVLHHTPARGGFDAAPARQARRDDVRDGLRPARLRSVTDILRRFMRRLPDERRYQACGTFVSQPLLARASWPFLMIALRRPETPTADEQTMKFGLFDAYSPR